VATPDAAGVCPDCGDPVWWLRTTTGPILAFQPHEVDGSQMAAAAHSYELRNDLLAAPLPHGQSLPRRCLAEHRCARAAPASATRGPTPPTRSDYLQLRAFLTGAELYRAQQLAGRTPRPGRTPYTFAVVPPRVAAAGHLSSDRCVLCARTLGQDRFPVGETPSEPQLHLYVCSPACP
jgi:hypothetical protein